jgi:Ion channel
MIQAFSKYSIEIKNLKFITEEGIRLPKTAIIQFHVEGIEKPIVEILGYMEAEEIYRLIDENKDINLDFCYINKLSISDYRSSRRLDKKELVSLKSFSAKNAFFDSNFPVDLSYININNGKFSLENSIFARGSFSLNYSQFDMVALDLSYMHFLTCQFDFSNVHINEGSISFKNTIFKKGKKDFQYTNFGNGEKNFTNVEFSDGDVSFINTQFNDGHVSFKIARFGQGKVDFHFAKFGDGDKTFERTEFGDGGTDFRTVEFGSGRVNFNRSVFGKGDTSFEGCQLENSKFSFKRASFSEGSLNFELAEMEGTDLSFERTNFGKGSISFYNSKLGNLSFNSCHLDNYTDLRLAKCGFIDLSNTIVRDIIDLMPYEFEEEIDSIHLGGMRLIGRIYIDWIKNHVYRLIGNQKDTSDRLKAEQFRTLKENFNICGQYNDEDKSYLQFKRHEAKADLSDLVQRNKWNILWAGPVNIFKWLIFDKAGHYATNPVRVIASMITSYIFFSLLFFLIIQLHGGDIIESVAHPGTITVLGKGFYHSAITFLTIGYGDYYPAGAIRWLSGFEGFVGVFLMSYFTVAFVRKILR